ncbi:hypothetical protein [Paenibacillus peoriae]|uniref:hypothetical protein n=1 Tax=Paenibacillus peoriae TaxID=59893 RepID=UPI00215A8AFC|nr:hypothetical protein [Paenibacillus peoriae]
MSATGSQDRYVMQDLYTIKGKKVIFNKQPRICIYRLKERFSLQNEPLEAVFTMCISGSRRYGRGVLSRKKYIIDGKREYQKIFIKDEL